MNHVSSIFIFTQKVQIKLKKKNNSSNSVALHANELQNKSR